MSSTQSNGFHNRVWCNSTQKRKRMLARSSRRLRCRQLLLLVPAAALAGIAMFVLRVQEIPSFSRKAVGELRTASGRATREPFQYTPDQEVYAFDFERFKQLVLTHPNLIIYLDKL